MLTAIKGEIDSNTIIVGDINTPLSSMDMNHTLNQRDLTNIFRIFHPTAAEFTFFSSTHGTFSSIE